MADNTLQSDIFKFVSLRPPVSADKKNQEINFISDSRKPEETPVGELVKSFNPEDGTKIPIQIKEFIQSNDYDLNYLQEDQILTKINDFITHTDKDSISNEYLSAGIEQIIDGVLSNYYSSENIQNHLHKIWDRYYAFYMLGRTEPSNLDNLTRILRIYHFIYLLTKNIEISDEQTLDSVFAAKSLVPKLFTDLPKPKVSIEAPKKAELDQQKVKEYKTLWADLIDSHRALEEIKNIRFDNKLLTETKDVTIFNNETREEENSKLTFFNNSLVVNKTDFEGLNANTKTLLRNFNITDKNLQLSEAITKLQSKLEKTNLAISGLNDARFMSYMPEEAKLIPGISSIASKFEYANILTFPIFIFPTNIRSAIKPLGIGDLKVVKQKLKKYVAGEVAHIENVLRGEYKERKHRVLDRTEDIFTFSNETDEETTKDTQTTERFELKKESEKTVQEQMSVQAGVTVSGSYGMVTFGAHGDFAYSTASQESNKSSSNFAREVIDKSVSKIQKKTKEERTTKKLHEVEEINTHGIDNKEKPEHTIGIYRWVDKYYDAQIYNYGKRMMFEFIIPEPATFYEYAQTHKPKKNLTPPIIPYKWIQDPTGKWVTAGLITHKDVTEGNYQLLIRDYNVQGISTPPPQFKVVSTILSSDANIQSGTALTKTSKELIVPEGYTLNDISFSLSAIYQNYPQLKLSIGASDIGWATLNNNTAARRYDFTSGALSYYEGIIPVSINCYDINSFFVNVAANCLRTDAKYEQWQIQAFEKIMAAYKAIQAEYEQKLAAQEVQDGITIHGQNPRVNREIESTELKKQCIKNLMDTYLFGSFDAVKDGDPPDFDIFDALEEGKTIQFLEQAFEWENITYLFYPYFWGRKDQWIHKITTYDTDPLFTKFLQAGSSRVVVPVHPAYNDAVMYYLENNGAIWKGGETPRLNDPLFISIAEELRNQTDDLAGAKPEGKPWEVVLPTTLVWLQPDDKLPTFE